ncbi:unnamed protein product [Adineta ricciae]|uniref:Uncharacterized protein n=1 Tax=Adineta ricciae TaxID=249248 RepID=A0A815MA44_ADIRI|nr:unnamed protein product [Adineta ricciae]CAF1540399.1 unnamed protein product [Adineta ricciae]
MIEVETKNARRDVDEWFHRIIEAKKKIMDNIDEAEKRGQDRLSEILTKLQQISIKINSLTKETLFDATQISSLLTDLDHVRNDLKNIIENKKVKLPDVTFNCEVKLENTAVPNTDVTPKDPSPVTEPLQSRAVEEMKNNIENVVLDWNDTVDQSETSDDSAPECLLPTDFPVDCMASDGINIMYSTYNTTPLKIAYCDLNNLQVSDRYRDWHQPSIVDMIYWKSIGKFICATSENVYTVEYRNFAFKIMTAIRYINCSDILVAANDASLWVWANPRKYESDTINVYSTTFQSIRTIKFGGTIPMTFRNGVSFSLTNNSVASINKRAQNNGYVVQISILNLDMIPVKTQDLGSCNGSIQIRSDEVNQFFVTTGQNLVHCVRTWGQKERIGIKYNGNSIAVLNNKKFVIGDTSNDVESVQL